MRLIRNLTVVFFLCTIILVVVYQLYRRGYDRYYSVQQAYLNEVINGKENYDILFLGSSRMLYHINPKIIDSITRLNSYNTGIGGANLLECKLILQCFLNSHKPPKIVVLDLAKQAFDIEHREFWNPTIYYPFLDNKIVFKELKPYEHVYMLKYFPFIRFLEADDMSKQNAFMGYLNHTSVDNKEHYKGYISFGTDTVALPFKRKYLNNMNNVDQDGLASLEEIIALCNRNNINLVFTFAPLYDAENDVVNADFFPAIKRYSSKYRIPFWDFRKDVIWNNHRLFVEELHLNSDGVNLYSKIVALKINENLNQ